VEVVNVSSGGMQLFSVEAVSEGCAARIRGAETECLCLIRYCAVVPGGHHVGLHFYDENRRQRSSDN
jgi:hypothetical protein